MVDGRDFFGGDPKIAIKNLPKDIIDKLQVMDNKSREARFNKTSTGNEDLAINLTLKKEVQKGWFGRVSAGYGSNDRYEGGAMINFFNGSKQLNFIGNSNNTNRGIISGSDFNMSNLRSTLDGGGGGLTRSSSGGLNFSDNVGRQLKLNGSYFYNSSHNDNFSKAQRKNILPDTSFYYNSENNSVNNYTNHRVSLNASYTIDTLTEINFNSYVSTNLSDAVTTNIANSAALTGPLINTSENTYSSKADGKYLTGEFFLSHRFRKLGRGFTLGFNYNYNDLNSTNDNVGQNDFYKNGSIDSTDVVNQRSFIKNSGNIFSFTATYSEPVTKYITAILRYNYNYNNNWSDKITNRFNSVTGKYDLEDSAYTNAFRNINAVHNPDISLSYNKDHYRASIGSGIQLLKQDNYSPTNTSALLQQDYINFSPSANVSYNFSKTGSVSLYYNGRSQQPSIQQLQPVPDNSNPLYVQLGNPDLRPSFFHNINVQVRESKGNNYWFTGLNFNTTKNQVIYQTWYDDVGRQITQPVNMNGNYGMSGNLQYSRTFKQNDVILRMNLGSNGYFNRNTSFTNKVNVISNSYSVSQSVGLNFTYKQLFSVMPAFNIRYNKTNYSQSIQDADFNTKTVSVSAFWNKPKWLIVENNLQYNYNSQIAAGFSKSVTMWSAAINCLLFKKQEGILRLAVYDILKQNAGVYRSISETYIEDRQTQVLQQYFLLSFIYNLRKFNIKDK